MQKFAKMNKVYGVVWFFVAIASKGGVIAELVTFYDLPQFQGEIYTANFNNGECYNLPANFNNRASSISTHGGCVVVFDEENCFGGELQLEPGTASHDDFKVQTFDNKVSSYRGCNNQESVNTSSPAPAESKEDEGSGIPERITFFELPNFRGKYFTVYYDNKRCHNLPGRWRNRASSVNIHDNCVVFHEKPFCMGEGQEVAPDRTRPGNGAALHLSTKVNSFQPCEF